VSNQLVSIEFSIYSSVKVNKAFRCVARRSLQPSQSEKLVSDKKLIDLSVIIPTYNESENILNLLDSIREKIPSFLNTEIIVVDDNSPDRTAELAECYSQSLDKANMKDRESGLSESKTHEDTHRQTNFSLSVIRRDGKRGLVSAIMEGIKFSKGQSVLVMDADLSHSPDSIPKMIHELSSPDIDIVVASRYMSGGSIIGWPFKRRLISKGAIKIAKYGLRLNKQVTDPMSGFFALKRHIIDKVRIDSAGYKILLEILVKSNEAKVKEIPYTFTNRKAGKSKLDNAVIWDYVKAVYHLYRYGRSSGKAMSWLRRVKKRRTVLFLSKAGRFYTVGASGLLINYFVSVLLFGSSFASLGYIQATIVGIIVSNISNFLLNKAWTFEDRDFAPRKTLRQYGLFAAISSGGAGIQLGALHVLLQSGVSYEVALLIAVGIASISNFLLNKKLTFREKIWG
jgi:dolichol-phosphate mannosyltransferase